ncbi:cuticle protein CP1158-like [Homarus americanus]|nr:cuticle protein CP1158-like [Homarus americanus]
MRFLVVIAVMVAAVGAFPSNAGYVLPAGNIGYSGIVRTDGTIEAFPGDFSHDIVLIGPSGIVTKSGKNVQLDRNLHRTKRSAGFVRPEGSVGYSGIVRTDGTIEAFPGDFSFDIVLIGPSGIVTKSGKNVQLDRNLHRTKRSAGFVRPEGSVGYSGIVRTDGTIEAFPGDFSYDIVLIGPSGIVTKSGKNVQLDRNLHRV